MAGSGDGIPHDEATQATLMRRALELAQQAVTKGNHPFGALLASPTGEVLLEAENTVVTGKDCTGHAETNLMRKASAELDNATRATAVMYTSTEPCIMCCGAVFWAGVRGLAFSCSHSVLEEIAGPSLLMGAADVLSHAAPGMETTVVGPVLPEEGRAVHEAFGWGDLGGEAAGESEAAGR